MAWTKILAGWRRWMALLVMASLLAGCAGFSFNLGGEPVKLKFVYLERSADYESLAKKFEEQNRNITIELTPIPLRGNVRSELISQLADADSVRLPVSSMDSSLFQAFMPMDSMISTSADFPLDDLFPGSLEGLRLDGKQYGLPAGLIPMVVFYVPERFQAFGVTPPPANWTLEDFVNVALAVHNPNESEINTDRYSYGFCSHPEYTDGAIFTYLFGGGLFDSLYQISAPTLNRQENIDALNWYAALKNDMGLMPPNLTPQQVGEMVVRSRCGLWIDWLDGSTFGGFRMQGGPGGIQGATPLPLPGFQKQFDVANIEGYFIMANTQHPEETWKWLSFLMQEQAASGSTIPPLKSQVNSNDYEGRVSEAVVTVARSLPEETVVLGLEMYRNGRFGSVIELFMQASDAVFTGAADAKSALDQAQQQAENDFR